MCSSFEVDCELEKLLTHGKKNIQGQQRSYSGLSRWGKALPKAGLFFKSIFAVKGSHRHLSPGFPAQHLISARAWRAPSERLFWTVGGCEARWECLGGFCFCFLALHLSGISLLQRTLCPHHSYSWSSPNTNPDSFCKDSWVKACPVFLFSPAIVFSCQQKWVDSCFIFKKTFLQIFSGSLSIKYSYLDCKLWLGT